MSRRSLKELWEDPAHWHLFGSTYRCAEDPRIVVYKRRRLRGWTLNFGHPQVGLVIAGLVLAMSSPLLILLYVPEDRAHVFLLPIYAVLLGVVLVLGKREADRTE